MPTSARFAQLTVFLLVALATVYAYNDSLIVNQAQKSQLSLWVNSTGLYPKIAVASPTSYQWKLCWRGTTHGFSSNKFHQCDYLGPTITIARSSIGWIFGGFNPEYWESPPTTSALYTTKSFIYSLTSDRNATFLSPVVNASRAIGNNPVRCAIFGFDFSLSDRANSGSCTSNFGDAYMLPQNYTYNTNAAHMFLAGSQTFSTPEVEVYALSMPSEILTEYQYNTLFSWTNTSGVLWTRCYSTNYHPKNDAFAFHSRCDNRGAFIVVFRTLGGYVAGGAANTTLRSMNANRNDHSILFSFSSGNPAGTRYNFGSGTFTVADFATQFPSFGSTDLIFPSNLETGNATSTFNFFVGSGSIAEGTSFKIVDMEIFVANNRSDVSCFGTSANALATCNFHGKCIGTDTCLCHPGWSGSRCNITSCFGITQTSPTVCNSRGSCNVIDTCSCNSTYYGAQCEISTCFGILGNNSQVCSSNGVCSSLNTCSCYANYTGTNCSIPICYSIAANNSAVCSGRGLCAAPNSCVCNTGYTNTSCQTPICFNVTATLPNACNGFGNCVAFNNCSCFANYGGAQCQQYQCFGINKNQPDVCSSHGACISYNFCNCSQGYGNDRCQSPVCYGYVASDPLVCNNQAGACNAPSNCTCNSNFTGNQCQTPICYTIPANDNSVCSNHGFCSTPNNCSCNANWTGATCAQTFCFGINSINPMTCSGRGTCIAPNNCTCPLSFTGAACEIPICFGFSNSSVCSAHGQCSSPDNCTCVNGYVGTTCNIPTCFALNASDPQVCSNHGVCNFPNNCTCSNGFTGASCNMPMCFGRSVLSGACSSNGVCTAPDSCSCYSNFTGSDCQLPICFGKNSTDNQVCSARGTCSAPNTCQCAANWIGATCDMPLCYSLPANSPAVCGGKGTCSSANICHCVPGYAGADCTIPVCYGKLGNDSTVCSSQGQCTSNNTCVCNNAYNGLDCSQPVGSVCFGISFNNPSVCNGRGNCTANNLCTCSSDFSGANCQFHSCFGISQESSLVCSGRGNCTTLNNCVCAPGYQGSNCSSTIPSVTYCYGFAAGDSQVCSSHGTCSGPNSCTCGTGYTGDVCQVPICYNVAANNANACSGRGTCSSPNSCLCNAGYIGTNCAQTSCYGIASSNSSVCSSSGSCIAPETCLCQNGFTNQCDVPVCYAIAGNSVQVCSNHGTCSAPSNCSCTVGYAGFKCDINLCFGIASSSPSVCSGHGSCAGGNKCTCSLGYTGNDCSIASCDTVPSTLASVCGGHGVCFAYDQCSCNSSDATGYWSGTRFCQTCSPNYDGPQCNVLRCNSTITCSGHGACSGVGTSCTCDAAASTGYWSGLYCSTCMPNYYGASCNKYCTASLNCSSKGECNGEGGCNCYASDELGQFQGTTCNTCKPQFFGDDCRSGVAASFAMADSGEKITGLMTSPKASLYVSCSQLFDANTLAKLGSKSVCSWPNIRNKDKRTFELILGQDSTIALSDLLTVNVLGLVGQTLYYNVSVTAPASAPAPVARINGPSQVGVCDGIKLDGSQSYSKDRRALRFVWRCLQGPRIAAINAYLATITSSSLYIESSLLDPSSNFEIALTVVNYFNQNNTASLNITKRNLAIPTISIRVAPEIRAVVSDFVKIEGVASANEACITQPSFTYVWRQKSGPFVLPSATNSRVLSIPAFTFAKLGKEQQYVFELTASIASNPSLSNSATISIIVAPQSLQAIIKGGSGSRAREQDFVLDGSSSVDLDKSTSEVSYRWACYDSTNSACNFANGFTLPTTAMVTIPKFVLLAGNYTFALTYAKDLRSDDTSVQLAYVDVNTPFVVIDTSLPKKINAHERVIVQGSARLSNGDANVVFQYLWNVTAASTGSVFLKPADVLTSTSQSILVIKANTFVVGESYTFTLIATLVQAKRQYTAVSSSATSTFTTVNDPPRVGQVSISPTNGTAAQTQFTITCSQFSDLDLPLRYAFGYYKGSQFVTLVAASQSNTATMSLPAGDAANANILIVEARVLDGLGAYVTSSVSVTVTPPAASSIISVVSSQAAAVQVATANSASETVTQLVVSATALLNNLAIVVPSPSTTCTNDCSAHGSCISSTCKCDATWYGVDCSISAAELAQRQALRQQLVDYVAQSVNASLSDPFTPEYLAQQAQLLADLTNNIDELSVEMLLKVLSIVKSLLTSALKVSSVEKVMVDDSTANIFALVLSNIFRTTYTPATLAYTAASKKQISVEASGCMNLLVDTVLASKVSGEVSVQFVQVGLTLVVQKAQSLSKLVVKSNFFDNTKTPSNVQLPSTLRTKSNAILATGTTNVQTISYVGNPYSYSPSSANISSSVLSFTLKSPNNSDIAIYDLEEPITFTISGSFNSSQIPIGCVLRASNIAKCQYWDTLSDSWRTNGCSMLNISNSAITCSCNHLTDFAGFVEYFTPEFNLLSFDDLNIFVKLNPDNFTTLVVMCILTSAYVLAMIIGFIVDRFAQPKTDIIRKAKEDLIRVGRIRKFFDYVLRYHIWLSIFIRPTLQRHFTRPQRITVIYLIILLTLVANALLYQKDKQATAGKVILAGIIAHLISIPGPFVIRMLFRKTSSLIVKKKKKKVDLDKAMTAELQDATGYLFGQSIEESLKAKHNTTDTLPPIVTSMLDHIELFPEALVVEKIDQKQFDALKNDIMQYDNEVDLDSYKRATVAQVLKQYVWELPDPLMNNSYDAFMKNPSSVSIVRNALFALPESNRLLATRIMMILRRLLHNHQITMTQMVYIANEMQLLRKKEETEKDDTLAIKSVYETMIRNGSIFQEEVKDDALYDKRKFRQEKHDEIKHNLVTAPVHKALDIGDDAVDKAELAVKKFISTKSTAQVTALGICASIILFVVYCCAFALVCIIGYFAFPRNWPSYYTTITICVAIVGIPAIFCLLYLNRKREIWRLEQRWDINTSFLFISGFAAVLCFVAVLVALATGTALEFWEETRRPNGVYHTVAIAIMFFILGIMGVAFVILNIRKPRMRNRNQKDYWFPWWFIIFLYPFCWAVIAVCSWVLVAYGIKFKQEVANAWLGSSFIGIGQDLVISKPIHVFLKFFVYSMIIDLMEAVFFRK